VKQGSGKAEHAVTPTIQSAAVRREREQSRKEHRRHCSPGDAACCLLASRGRQAVSQPCRRTVSDHAWLVLGWLLSMRYDWRHAPCRYHTPLSSRNGVPDQATGSPSLRLREPTPTAACNPLVWYARQEKAAQKHAANGWDDGCGAHGRYFYPVGMDGSMQLATAAQRRKNLDAIHGGKRVESIAFVDMSSGGDKALRVQSKHTSSNRSSESASSRGRVTGHVCNKDGNQSRVGCSECETALG
jgi:hypothetical protein